MKKHLLFLYCMLLPFVVVAQTIKGSAIQRNSIPAIAEVHSGGTIEYRLSPHNTSGKIQKPLIVAEGFDPNVVVLGNFNANLASFLRESHELTDIGTIDVPYSNGPGRLLDDLDLAGYDIIYLDYANGIDCIWRNAQLFRQVIDSVNKWKVGDEPNVVMGISMGGLVARIALRQMELDNEDHQTRIYISMDAPHKGANVPIGFQAAVRHMLLLVVAGHIINVIGTGDVQEILAANYLLESPAAEQMLIYTINQFFSIRDSVHKDFLHQYDALGFPQLTKNIAISNGSNNGSLTFPSSSEVINGKDLSLNAGNLRADIEINALPASTVYQGHVFTRGTFLGMPIIWTIPLVGVRTVSSIASMLPIDGAPGGKYSLDMIGLELHDELADMVQQPAFNFIPTVSALALPDWNTRLTQNLGTNVANSPFSSMFTQTQNELHTRFNSSAAFIRDHLIAFSISGPSAICGYSTATYEVQGLPPNYSVDWGSITDPLVEVDRPEPHIIQLKRNPLQSQGTAESRIITATIKTPQGVVVTTLNKYVTVGTRPNISYISTINNWKCTDKNFKDAITYQGERFVFSDGGISGEFWQNVPPPNTTATVITHTAPGTSIPMEYTWGGDRDINIVSWNPDGFAYIQVKLDNACGSSGWVDIRYRNQECNNHGPFPNRHECASYFIQKDGIYVQRWCPLGQYFDPVSKECGPNIPDDCMTFVSLYHPTYRIDPLSTANCPVYQVHIGDGMYGPACPPWQWFCPVKRQCVGLGDPECPPCLDWFTRRLVYPNPTKDILVVDFLHELQLADAIPFDEEPVDLKELDISIKLYDNMGIVQRQARHKHRRRGNRDKSSVNFNTSNLREGTYFLHIEYEGEIEKHQIIVERQ
ncbi:MAG: hypothetical protein FWG79_04995 [Bacteroidales bacterium]|nr:hypothetical protein [Bacteroidales bacterium]